MAHTGLKIYVFLQVLQVGPPPLPGVHLSISKTKPDAANWLQSYMAGFPTSLTFSKWASSVSSALLLRDGDAAAIEGAGNRELGWMLGDIAVGKGSRNPICLLVSSVSPQMLIKAVAPSKAAVTQCFPHLAFHREASTLRAGVVPVRKQASIGHLNTRILNSRTGWPNRQGHTWHTCLPCVTLPILLVRWNLASGRKRTWLQLHVPTCLPSTDCIVIYRVQQSYISWKQLMAGSCFWFTQFE